MTVPVAPNPLTRRCRTRPGGKVHRTVAMAGPGGADQAGAAEVTSGLR